MRTTFSWPSRHEKILALLLLGCVTFSLYGDALQGWWWLDDTQILKHAVFHRPWEYFFDPQTWKALSPSNLTPWVTLCFDMDYTLFGFHPVAFYAHNLLAITLCSWLIYLISRDWVAPWTAGLGAVFFLVGPPIALAAHQLMVRHYVEGLLFFLLSLWLFVRAVLTERIGFTLLAGLAFAISATAKEIYLPLGFVPVLMPIGTLKKRISMSWPLFFVMMLYVPWRWYMLGDVIGGYTPASEFSLRDMAFASAYFSHIPTLLFTPPVAGHAALLGMGVTAIFFSKTPYLTQPLWLITPIILLAPLLPVAQGLPADHSERLLIAFWAMTSLGCMTIAGSISKTDVRVTKALCWGLSIVFPLMLVSAWGKTRALNEKNRELQTVYTVQGTALTSLSSKDVLYLTPEICPWYIQGLMDLETEKDHPLLVSDESALLACDLEKYRIFRYDRNVRSLSDITLDVPRILEEWRKNLKAISFKVEMEFDPSTQFLRWDMRPQNGGTYTAILPCGQIPIPPSGAIRMGNPLWTTFRLRYDEPDGGIAYTDCLTFPQGSGKEKIQISWHGDGVTFEGKR